MDTGIPLFFSEIEYLLLETIPLETIMRVFLTSSINLPSAPATEVIFIFVFCFFIFTLFILIPTAPTPISFQGVRRLRFKGLVLAGNEGGRAPTAPTPILVFLKLTLKSNHLGSLIIEASRQLCN